MAREELKMHEMTLKSVVHTPSHEVADVLFLPNVEFIDIYHKYTKVIILFVSC